MSSDRRINDGDSGMTYETVIVTVLEALLPAASWTVNITV
jgi:hypothetical protein